MGEINKALGSDTLEDLWTNIREAILMTAKETCGTTKINTRKKQTRWWTEEIKTEVKLKKQRWKKYLRNRNELNYKKYKDQRTKVKEMVQKSKEQSWEEFGKKMERDRHGNQKLFYKVLKTLRKGEQNNSNYVKDKDGRLIVGEEKVMSRWREYFEDMLTIRIPYKENEIEGGVEENTLDNEKLGEEGDINIEEVVDAVQMLKRGKAAGHDGITSEMVKNLGRNGIEILTKLFNLAWKEEKIPEEWEIGILLPIHKKGDKKECTNYRGITMLCIISKVYEKVLEKRLKAVIGS